MTPFTIRDKITNQSMAVPCGKCPSCYARRASSWSFRLMEEEKISSSSLFLTLTYDTKHVSITQKGFMQIQKRDVQLFFKRLRKTNENKIKYFAVGEYGGKTNRPHYHIILFNAKQETIQPSWQLGSVHYGQVTGASIGYTLKYISKLKKIPLHKNDDRQPEFALMSKGLGKNYLTPQMVQWHKNIPNERLYVNLLDGKKCAMPRYYKQKIYEKNELKAIGLSVRQKMLQDKYKLIESDDLYFTKQYAAYEQAFTKMERNLTLNTKI